MRHDKATDYHTHPTPDDDIFVFFMTRNQSGKKARIVRFCIEYKTHVEGRWRKVIRYDNSHGLPHKHAFDWHGETERVELGSSEESGAIFNRMLEFIKKNYATFKRAYLSSRTK